MSSSKAILFIFTIFSILLLPVFIQAGTAWSNSPVTFNATPSPLYINWSNSYDGNLTLSVNSSYSAVLVMGNTSHTIKANYSQPSSEWSYGQSSYDPSLCGLSGNTFKFYVKNETGYYSETRNLTGETTWVSLERIEDNCPPGKYYGLINVSNSSASSHYATVVVYTDLPITSSNSFSSSSGAGQFRGTLGTTDKTYHSYFFNTSEVPNATTITVFVAQDADVFLFDSGVFKAKNILGTAGRMVYQYVPQNDIWEIRIFENSSSTVYGGTLAFSTINATNSSNPSQQLSFINFGSKSPSDASTVDVRLENEGNLTLSSVTEGVELYHKDSYAGSLPGNVSFRVPDFATKVRAELRWSGSANYTLKLYKPDGTLATTSDGNYLNANASGATQEETAEYVPSETIGSSDDGLWKVGVVNNTVATGSYNLDFIVWLDAEDWLGTNYTTTTFNTTGETKDFSFNLTVQNLTLAGIYNGSLGYTSDSGAILKIPFTANVTAPELFVNNTFSASSINMNENTGANRTITLNITVNNTGNQDLTLSKSNSTSLDYSTNYMNFSYVAPSSLAANSSSLINVTIDIDTTNTNDVNGTYVGWIHLNDSNARPYEEFNLTIQVNLNDNLTVYLVNISTKDGDATITNASISENVTLKTKVYYANGTAIEDNLGLSNFGSVFLRNKNYTTDTISIPDSALAVAFGTLWQGSPKEYHLNFTLTGSSTRPGGYYDVYASANKSLGGLILRGMGYNGTLVIPGVGLFFTETEHVDDFDEIGQINYYEIKAENFGTSKASTQMNLSLDSDCEDYIDVISLNVTSGCGDDSTGTKFTLDINPGETCYFKWQVKVPTTVSDDYNILEECDLYLKTEEKNYHSSLPHDSFDIDIASGTDGSTTATTDEDEVHLIEIKSYPQNTVVTQGDRKELKIVVENTGDVTENNLKLAITGIDSSWYNFTPSEINLVSGEYDQFEINVTASSDAEIKEYDMTFKVSNNYVSDTKNSKMKVMPSEQEKERINESYSECLANYTELEFKMKQMFLEGKNATELNETLTQVKSKLEDFSQFIGNEDYYNASLMEDEILSLLSTAAGLIEEESAADVFGIGESKNYIWLFVGVIVIIVAGLILYMFMPAPKESHVVKKFKYVPPEASESPLKKIKKKFGNTAARLKKPKKEEDKKAGYSWKKK